MVWRFVVEEFVLQQQGHEPKEWVGEDLIQVCDAINVETGVISLEIVRIASMVTKGHRAQEEVGEEDTILKIEIGIVLMTEGLMIVVTS